MPSLRLVYIYVYLQKSCLKFVTLAAIAVFIIHISGFLGPNESVPHGVNISLAIFARLTHMLTTQTDRHVNGR